MKHTKKLLSVLLAALLLAGCCALAFSAVAAGNAPQGYARDDVVLLPFDTDGLKDGDWYFDLDTYVADVVAEAVAAGNEVSDDDIARFVNSYEDNTYFLFNLDDRTIYWIELDYYYNGDPLFSFIKPGEEPYDELRPYIKQYQAPAPTDPGTTDPGTTDPGTPAPAASVCPWCGGAHEGFFQGIVGWIHGILANIFGAKF